jgi:hypothetical protein
MSIECKSCGKFAAMLFLIIKFVNNFQEKKEYFKTLLKSITFDARCSTVSSTSARTQSDSVIKSVPLASVSTC